MAHLSFQQSVIAVMKTRIFDFRGRACRSEYWFGALFFFIANFVLSILGIIPVLGSILGLIGGIWLFIASISVTVRRLHDVDRSGWYILLPYGVLVIAAGLVGAAAASGNQDTTMLFAGIGGLLVLAVFILMFIWFIKPGTAGDNRFGQDPLLLDPSYFTTKHGAGLSNITQQFNQARNGQMNQPGQQPFFNQQSQSQFDSQFAQGYPQQGQEPAAPQDPVHQSESTPDLNKKD